MKTSIAILVLSVGIANVALAIPNPSATYCIECGYEYDIRPDGTGVCVFPDSSECEAWSFFRKCNASQSCDGDCNCPRPCLARIIYVDDDATGANNGSSWKDAYCYLQDALMTARRPDEIRVAQGIYRPDDFILSVRPSLGRVETFQLKSGVILKGGYAGIGTPDPNARDIQKYQSILSGDLNADDAAEFVNNRENSFHVVTGSGTDGTAVLDSFIITGGNASHDWDWDHTSGAGMYNKNGSPAVKDCAFVGNYAGNNDGGGSGGAIYNYQSNPTIINCTFAANHAVALDGGEGYGGAIYNFQSSPNLSNCIFNANVSGHDGGAMWNEYSHPVLTNCTFVGNLAREGGSGSHGGAIRNYGSNPILTNCIFINNTARSSQINSAGGAMYNALSNPRLSGCTFTGNTAEQGGGIYNLFRSPSLQNCSFSANRAEEGGAIYNDSSDNVTLTGCVLTGNLATQSGGAMYNWCDSDPVLTNCTFADNYAPRGASLASGNPALANCIVWDTTGRTTNLIETPGTAPIRYSCVMGGWPGTGNLASGPYFVAPGHWDPNNTPDDPNNDIWIAGDYHVKSQAGRWDARIRMWVKDDVTSPSIDAGDPMSAIGAEPFPNGGRINMGAYGGTAQASKSYFGAPVCETIVAGDINGDCRVDFADFEIMALHWLEDNTPVNSNSVVKDGIQYYIQTDKSVYRLGESVEILYRVTNVSENPVDIEGVLKCEYAWSHFAITDNNNTDIWQYIRVIPPCGMTTLHLDPYESKEYQKTWNMINDNGTMWNNDDFPVGPGSYNIRGELELISGGYERRVPVSVLVEIGQ